MKRVQAALLVIAVVGLTLTGCSSDDSDNDSSSPTTGVTVPTTAAGTTVNIEVSDTDGVDGPMTMAVSPASVAAGPITFEVENTGTIEHEMVVIKTDIPVDQLPVNAEDKVSEEGALGEVEKFAAGTTESITLDVTAGSYALVCNIAKHYGLGMYAAFAAT